MFLVIKGGLGNQLFQLAISYFVRSKLGREVTYLASHLPEEKFVGKDGIDVWPSYFTRLDPSIHQLTGIKSTRLRRLASILVTIDERLGTLRSGFGAGRFKRWINFDIPTDFFDAALKSGPMWVNFSGSSRLAAIEARNYLREVFIGVSGEEKLTEPVAKALKAPPLMVHWRRGDYKGLEHLYGELTANYYCDGVLKLRKPDQPVWLFTDAIGVEASMLGSQIDASVVFGGDCGLDAIETLALMTLHDGMVCSNSTFSWWAAFLSFSKRIEVPPMDLRTKYHVFRELGVELVTSNIQN